MSLNKISIPSTNFILHRQLHITESIITPHFYCIKCQKYNPLNYKRTMYYKLVALSQCASVLGSTFTRVTNVFFFYVNKLSVNLSDLTFTQVRMQNCLTRTKNIACSTMPCLMVHPFKGIKNPLKVSVS